MLLHLSGKIGADFYCALQLFLSVRYKCATNLTIATKKKFGNPFIYWDFRFLFEVPGGFLMVMISGKLGTRKMPIYKGF